MRFLRSNTRSEIGLTKNLHDNHHPTYAILSHTWAENDEDEVLFAELETAKGRQKTGYKKIQFCIDQAKRDGIEHCWIDTCCINKSNSSELSEAITSMYRWYASSRVCYVYLSDVSIDPGSDEQDLQHDPRRRSWKTLFRRSRWFTRGWTLQELVAPKEVVFYSKEGQRLGTKRSLGKLLHEITGIPLTVLRGQSLDTFSIDERMSWAEGRITKRKEDQAYCLLGLFNVHMYLNYGEGDHALVRLKKELEETSKVKITLPVVRNATFDAYGQDHQKCCSDTRTELLQSIRDWAQDTDGKSVFWLNGEAGTGKSTISVSVAKWLSELRSDGPVALGASFFFKRGEGSRASAALLFPTIADQLAARNSQFAASLARMIQAHPQICDKSLDQQFEKLIYEPLGQLSDAAAHPMYVVVIDALDECDKAADIYNVLQLWSTLPEAGCPRLRLFLTSRSEDPIRQNLKRLPVHRYEDVKLHNVPPSVIRHDILTFLRHALAKVREDYNLGADEEPLANDWPNSQRLEQLTDIAFPLFIVAATMHRFIHVGPDPEVALDIILRFRRTDLLFDVGQMYTVVLQNMTALARDTVSKEIVYYNFRRIVGAVVCLMEPLSRVSLAALLEHSSNHVRLHLQSVHAVLQIPEDEDALIQPLHLSFGEFLTSREAQGQPFGVNAQVIHSLLWKQCLQLLSGSEGLQEDICDLGYSGQLQCEISETLVDQRLRPVLRYACRYWSRHFLSSQKTATDDGRVHTFLQKHLLHWLEAMSLLKLMNEAMASLDMLHAQISARGSTQEFVFLNDARRFVRSNRHIIEKAPLQIYSSAIVFAPQSSIVKSECGKLPSYIPRYPSTPDTWGQELFKLEGHEHCVVRVAFSPDGKLLASASGDATIRLWDPKTGQELRILRGHTESVQAIVFLSNKSLLASGSADTTVRLWDAETGQELRILKGHKDWIDTLVFSPNGSLLASGSEDATIRLWDPETGQELQVLRGHEHIVHTVVFSPNGSLLASGSEDTTVRLWDPETGQELQVLKGHKAIVDTVIFLSSGLLLTSACFENMIRVWDLGNGQIVDSREHPIQFKAIAFLHESMSLGLGCADGTVRLWNLVTGKVQTLYGHKNSVSRVAINRAGSLLASTGYDATVRVWDLRTGQGTHVLEGHFGINTAVQFSPDSSVLVSASGDKTVRVWDLSAKEGIQVLEGRTQAITDLVFSTDGSLLASASEDGIVRVRDATSDCERQQLVGHTDAVRKVIFSPDDTMLASGSDDRTIRLWDLSIGGREIRTFIGHTDSITTVAFSADGLILASASDDSTIRLWDPTTGCEVRKLECFGSRVRTITFSPDSSLLASGSEETVIRLWDVSTGLATRTLNRHIGNIRAVAFSSNSLLLASACHTGYLKVWSMETGQELNCIHTGEGVCRIEFILDDDTLLTENGFVDRIEGSSSHAEHYSARYGGPVIDKEWVYYRGQRILWLPPEYRGIHSIIRGNTLATRLPRGILSILQLRWK